MCYCTKPTHHLLSYYIGLFNSSNSYHEFQSLKNRFDVLTGKARRKKLFNASIIS